MGEKKGRSLEPSRWMPTNAMDALTCEEREEVEQEGMDEMDIGLGALAHKHGLDKIMESAAHMSLETEA